MDEKSILPAILFTTFALLILFTATIVVIMAAHKERLKQKMKLSEARVQYQQELRLVAAEVQEGVLKRLSEEVHNNLGQKLTLINIQLQQYAMKTAGAGSALDDISANVVETIKQVRDLSHALNAEIITSNGIMNMVRQEAERLSHNGKINIIYKENGDDPNLTADQQLVAFRIFQEAINNALKHSEAKDINVNMSATPLFTMEIADNGIGFDRQRFDDKAGAGLNLIQQRASMTGLDCTIISKPGQGTICRIAEKIAAI